MDTLGRIEIFLEVAKRRSFAQAARALGMTGPAASKQVMALEDELGVKLLRRTTRLVTLTDEGATYYERARLAIDELKDAAAELQDMTVTPRGSLRISVPAVFGETHLLPVLAGFARKYPALQLDVSFDDRMIDVIGEGFDLVIRIGVLQDSTLVAKQLAACPICPVASPAYLKAHGTPKTPEDLKHHQMIVYSNQGGVGEWRYRGPDGKLGNVRMEGVFRSNNAQMMLQAALDGVGIAILPVFAYAAQVKAKQLVQLLPKYETHPARTITALMPPNRHRATKVKLLLEWLSQAFKAMPLE